MGEHLDADRLASRADDGLLEDRPVDRCHLVHVQLTSQHDDIGELRIEAQGFDIGDIELGREVDFDPDATSIEHRSDIRCDDGRYLGSLRRIDDLTHES